MNYLTVDDVIGLHGNVMSDTGSPRAPLRDRGLLESALARPEAVAYCEEADLIRQATLLAVGISQAQAFIDGNKRTAFAAIDVFLRINGAEYAGDPIAIADQLILIAEHQPHREQAIVQFEAWLRDRVNPITREKQEPEG